MDKSIVGRSAIILGSLVLSLELYGLKIIQGLEMQKGSWRTYAIDYISEFPVVFGLCIAIAVIIYGIVLTVGTDKMKKYFKY